MILLDTNVVSALMHPKPETVVVKWLDTQPRPSIWITSITVMEIRYGLQVMPKGRRRDDMLQRLERLLAEKIEGRVASFDTGAAQQAGDLMARRKAKGRMGEVRDTMIAGIAPRFVITTIVSPDACVSNTLPAERKRGVPPRRGTENSPLRAESSAPVNTRVDPS